MSKTLEVPMVEGVMICYTCKVKHSFYTDLGNGMMRECCEWENKHKPIEHGGKCLTDKLLLKRFIPGDLDDSQFTESPWWLDRFKPNANIKVAFASAVNLTTTLASLASDSALLAGRASTAIDETSNLYLDEGLSGFITNGTSPTLATGINVYVYTSVDDGPTYPSGGTSGGTRITGSDAGFAFATVNQYNSGLKFVAGMTISATSNETNNFGTISLCALCGGFMPHKWGVWVVHNTGVNLNSTGGNHQITAKPLYATSI